MREPEGTDGIAWDRLAVIRERARAGLESEHAVEVGPIGVGADGEGAIAGVLERLAAEDLDGLPVGALGEEALRLLAAAEALRTEAVRRLGAFDDRQGWVGSGARSLAGWVAQRGPMGGGEARSLAATARLAGSCPPLAQGLAEGSLDLAAARMVAGAVTPERERLFLSDPAPLLGAVRSVARRDVPRVVGWWRSLADDRLGTDDATGDHDGRWASASALPGGRVRFGGILDAAGGAALLAGLDDLMAPDPEGVADGPRTARQRRADAFAELARRHLATRRAEVGGQAPGVGVEVHLGLADLLAGLGCVAGADQGTDGEVPGGALVVPDDPALAPSVGISEVDGLGPVARCIAARLACDADLGRLVDVPDQATVAHLLGVDGPLASLRDTPLGRRLLDAPSQPLDIGRRMRPFTSAQRRAIVARDGRCRFPGCDRPPAWCDVHHLHPWGDGGPTDLANGLLLCAHHHTVVHLRRWRPHRLPDGTWTVVPPGEGEVGGMPAGRTGRRSRPP